MPVSAKEVLRRIKEKNNAKLEQAIEAIDKHLDSSESYNNVIIFNGDFVQGIKQDIKRIYGELGWEVDYCVNNDNTITFDFLVAP